MSSDQLAPGLKLFRSARLHHKSVEAQDSSCWGKKRKIARNRACWLDKTSGT